MSNIKNERSNHTPHRRTDETRPSFELPLHHLNNKPASADYGPALNKRAAHTQTRIRISTHKTGRYRYQTNTHPAHAPLQKQYYRHSHQRRRIRPLPFVVGAIIIVFITNIFILRSCSSSSSEQTAQDTSETTAGQSEEVSTEEELQQDYSSDIRSTDFSISSTTTNEAFWTSDAYGRLTQAIGTLEDDGNNIGIVLIDLESGTTLTYDQDMETYPASSIKGPYITSLYEQLVETGEVDSDDLYDLAYSIIINSDNTVYGNTRRAYGSDVFEQWLEDAGVSSEAYDSLDDYSSVFYPTTTPRQLATMWLHIYDYITQDTASGATLAGLFANREVSAIKDALGDSYLTWGKAGWYPSYDGSNSAPATVDAGIVWSDSGPYAVVVMSTVASDIDELTPIFAVLDEVHEQLIAQDDKLTTKLGLLSETSSHKNEFQLETGLF